MIAIFLVILNILTANVFEFRKCNDLIENFHLQEAYSCIKGLSRGKYRVSHINFLFAKYYFYRGDLPFAKSYLNKIKGEKNSKNYKKLKKLVLKYLNILQSYAYKIFDKGRKIYVKNKRDFVLKYLLKLRYQTIQEAMNSIFESRGIDGFDIVVPDSVEDLKELLDYEVSLETFKKWKIAGGMRFDRVFLLSPAGKNFAFFWYENLVHEIAHVYTVYELGDNIPAWIKEGLCVWVTEKVLKVKGRKEQNIAEGDIKAFLKILDENSMENVIKSLKPEVFYYLSYALVKRMISKIGKKAFFKRVKSGKIGKKFAKEVLKKIVKAGIGKVSSGQGNLSKKEKLQKLLTLARLFSYVGEDQAALSMLGKAYESDESPETGVKVLTKAVNLGEYELASRVCESILNGSNGSVAFDGFLVRFYCGMSYYQIGFFKKAYHHLMLAALHYPYSVELYTMLYDTLDKLKLVKEKLYVKTIIDILKD